MNIHEVDFSKMPTCACDKALNELDPHTKVTRILRLTHIPYPDACSNLNLDGTLTPNDGRWR